MEEFHERGLYPHYVLMRPKFKSANKLNDIYNKKGPEKALEYAENLAGKPKDYKLSRAIWEAVKREALPTMNKEEFAKSPEVRKFEKKMTGGICSTTAGLLTNRTISGKSAKDVLPKDIVRSPDFEAVAYIGQRNLKDETSMATRMVFAAPKYAVKAGVGVGVGATTYGIVKGVQAMV